MSDQQNPATPEGTDAPGGYTPEAEASLKSQIAALEAAASELKGAAKGVNTNQQKKLKAELVELLKLKPEGDTEGGEDTTTTPAQTATTTPTVTLSPDDVYVKTVIDNLPGAVIKPNRNAAFDSPKVQREAILYAREVAEANQARLDEIEAMTDGEDKDKALAEFSAQAMTMQELARRTGYEVNGAFRRRIRYLIDNGQIPVEPVDEAKVKKPRVVAATTTTPQTSGNGTDAADDAQTSSEGQEGTQQATTA